MTYLARYIFEGITFLKRVYVVKYRGIKYCMEDAYAFLLPKGLFVVYHIDASIKGTTLKLTLCYKTVNA